MLASLGKIENPLTRSVAAATTAFSTVAIASAIIIGFTKPKDETAHKFAVYSSLLAAGCGAALGFVNTSKNTNKNTNQVGTTQEDRVSTQEQQKDSSIWQNWRNFVVARKVKESEEITSFYLKPEDGAKLPDFKPGQFLTIKLDIPSKDKPVIRTYSLSDYTDNGEYYRLSIKREPAPKDLEVPPGVASNFMHENIEEGSVIPAKPPNGKFFLDIQKSLPAVLISNGVGITPMMSMAKACSIANPSKHIWFVHGARNGDFHAFRDSVKTLAQDNSNIHLHFRYSRPRSQDEGNYDSVGYVDKDLIQQSIIPQVENIHTSPDAEYFLCGSPPFLESLITGLKELGVSEDKIFYESFSGGVSSSVKNNTQKNKADTSQGNENSADGNSSEIVFAKSGKTLTWNQDDGTILEFAEANGIDADYSCRQGICLTCMCNINDGEVEYEEPPTGTPDEGSVLICVSKPKSSRIELDL
ncbi:MAG: 2Fe-2S iron-sulfur cluster-binding protein [Cyanobacteria bacterium P01_A01_bin.68]